MKWVLPLNIVVFFIGYYMAKLNIETHFWIILSGVSLENQVRWATQQQLNQQTTLIIIAQSVVISILFLLCCYFPLRHLVLQELKKDM